MPNELYTDGSYLARNPSWHVEDSGWKVDRVAEMLQRNALKPQTVGEVGCGAGEILRLMQERLLPAADFVGYEISPQAHALAQKREREGLRFVLGDITEDARARFDLLLVLDVIEHVDDPHTFLRGLRDRGDVLLLHVPLDLSSLSVARPRGLIAPHDELGHVHYFMKDTALQLIRDSGYRIDDWAYTYSAGTRAATSNRDRLLNGLRRGLAALDRDLAVRLLGGYSLMVVART